MGGIWATWVPLWAALGLLGQPAAWAVDTSAFEAKAAKYKAEREKRELTKPVVTSSVETAACVAGQLQCGPRGCLAEAGRTARGAMQYAAEPAECCASSVLTQTKPRL